MGEQLSLPICALYIHREYNDLFEASYSTANGKRFNNEDTHCMFKLSNDRYITGIFDGHSGINCAKYVSENLPLYFIDKEINSELIINSCLEIDKNILNDPIINNSGCTATFSFIEKIKNKYKVHICNIGDSFTFIIRNNDIFFITKEHKPNDECEYTRIINAGGFVRNNRVNGELALSRAFGDISFKNGKEITVSELEINSTKLISDTCDEYNLKVIAIPDISIIECDENDIIVHICDGIVETDFHIDNVCRHIIEYLEKYKETSYASSLLCLDGLEKGSCDNVSCMIIKLNNSNFKNNIINDNVKNELVISPFIYEYRDIYYNAYNNIAKMANMNMMEVLNQRKNIINHKTTLTNFQQTILNHNMMTMFVNDINENNLIKNWEKNIIDEKLNEINNEKLNEINNETK